MPRRKLPPAMVRVEYLLDGWKGSAWFTDIGVDDRTYEQLLKDKRPGAVVLSVERGVEPPAEARVGGARE